MPLGNDDLEDLRLEMVELWVGECNAMTEMPGGQWQRHRRVCSVCLGFDDAHRRLLEVRLGKIRSDYERGLL